MSAPLVIAVPAKGRLQANAEAFFARAPFHFAHACIRYKQLAGKL